LETLESILQQDILQGTSDLELFSMCKRWCEENSTAGIPHRESLGNALNHIRFLTFTAQQFASIVCPSKLLTTAEESAIFCCIVNGKGYMPDGFSNCSISRSGMITGFIQNGNEVPENAACMRTLLNNIEHPATVTENINESRLLLAEECIDLETVDNPCKMSESEQKVQGLVFSVSTDVFVVEIGIKSIIKNYFTSPVENGELYIEDCNGKTISQTTFQCPISCNSFAFCLRLKQPCLIPANVPHTLICNLTKPGLKCVYVPIVQKEYGDRNRVMLEVKNGALSIITKIVIAEQKQENI
jgi:hypothetical protein